MAKPIRAARGRRRGSFLAFALAALLAPLSGSSLGASLADGSAGGLANHAAGGTASRPADAAARPAAAPGSRPLLDQKHILVAHLVSSSPLARRIDASDNGAAKGYLTTAREALVRAQTALADSDLALADRELDAAITNVRAARELVPPPDSDLMVAKARHAHLLASVQALRAGYAGLVVGDGAGAADPRARPAQDATALIDAAQELARGERYGEAGERLRQAQAILLAAYQQNLTDPTVVYPRHFADPATQFDHELARFQGYHALVPVALEKLRPAEKNRGAIEGQVEHAKRLETRAREQAARGDWTAGLASLDGATAALERALAIAGVSVPVAGQQGDGGQ